MLLNLKDLVKKYDLQIKGVIHVGAHYGEEDETYLDLNLKNIHYFEPVKKTFDVLKSRMESPLRRTTFLPPKLYNYALGSKEEKSFIHVEDKDLCGASSILEPTKELTDHMAFSTKQEVQIKTLDSFNIVDSNFLNIDVQGYEYEVLCGAKSTLNNVDYIMMEVNRHTEEKGLFYKGIQTIDVIENFLKQYNFVLKDISWAGICWGDGFFIKDKIK